MANSPLEARGLDACDHTTLRLMEKRQDKRCLHVVLRGDRIANVECAHITTKRRKQRSFNWNMWDRKI